MAAAPTRKALISKVLELHVEKKTFGQIAVKLDMTRAAVAGIVDRARRNGDVPASPRRRLSAAERIAAAPRGKRATIAPVVASEPIPDALIPPLEPPPLTAHEPAYGVGPAVLALRPNDCRWPIGELSAPDFRFCCDPIHPGRSDQPLYCRSHLQRALSGDMARRRFGIA